MRMSNCLVGIFVIALICCVISGDLPAGEGELAWAQQINADPGRNQANAVSCYEDKYCVLVGTFRGTAVFGQGEPGEVTLSSWSSTWEDTYIARYNYDRTLAWARRAGGMRQNRPTGVSIADNGYSVVAGWFEQTAVFGEGEVGETILSADGLTNSFIAKYSQNGALMWAKRVAGGNSNYCTGVASFADGSSVVTGYFSRTVVLGVGENNETMLSSEGGVKWNAFIARYNADGTLNWAKRSGASNSTVMSRTIASFQDGSSVIAGEFYGTAVFGEGETNESSLVATGNGDLFIARYNPDGTLNWVKQTVRRMAGEEDRIFINDIASFYNGSLVITGGFSGTVVFGNGETNESVLYSPTVNIFIARYNEDGTLAWAKSAGGNDLPHYDAGQGISTFIDGSSVITGRFSGTAVFGNNEPNQSTITSYGASDVFIAKYDLYGSLAWVRQAGGNNWSQGIGNASYSDGSLLVSGQYYGEIVFGRGETNETILSNGSGRSFIARLGGLSSATSTPTPTPPISVIDSGDYTGDGTSDLAIFRPSSGLWAVRGVTRAYFGSSGDLPVPGDYIGNGTTDIAIFRANTGLWAVRGGPRVYFGTRGDIPVPGDYTGDGTVGVAVFRPSSGLWAVLGVTRVYFGSSNDIPVPGYYDGIQASPGIFRPSSGLWAIQSLTRTYFGSGQDEPVPGDYDGEGFWSPAIFRETSGLWAVRDGDRIYFGAVNDTPLPGGYRGDGRDYPGIFRSTSGLWAIRGLTRVYFGSGQDVPVTR